jgi:phosphate transport system protein
MEDSPMNSRLDTDLDGIRTSLRHMGDKVELMIADAVKALGDRDSLLAEQVICCAQRVNYLGQEIDDTCLRLLSEHRNLAQADYFLTQALKIVIDLERISSQCAGIARSVLELNQEARLKPCVDLTVMANAAKSSVKEAVNAFVAGNNSLTFKVYQGVQVVEYLNEQIQRVLLTIMMEDPATIWRAMRINAISKYLETIADHAGNIAETVTLMADGKYARGPAA